MCRDFALITHVHWGFWCLRYLEYVENKFLIGTILYVVT